MDKPLRLLELFHIIIKKRGVKRVWDIVIHKVRKTSHLLSGINPAET